jgi:predicted CXXCH cytochrome family protein
LTLLLAGVAGCVDEEAVFVDKPPFDEPADTANKFLGYVGDPADGQTSCGNCHATFQASWSETGHAEAWEVLQGSGAAQPFCEGCHTVSELGNALTDAAGYKLVKSERYTDVQCESCHGPGWDHVNDPTHETAPLASIRADTAATIGCGECHSGTHHPFVEQWSRSRHRNMVGFPQGRAECAACHEGRRALEVKFHETSDYVEKDGDENMPIGCAVCHDPHGTPYAANLRAPIEEQSLDNLCVRCHARRGTPPSKYGPHAAQGLLLLSEDVGWIPAGFQVPPVSAHGSAANRELCVTCHVSSFDVTDPATGDFVFRSVGHTFEAIPCLDAEGLPTEGPCTIEQRDFRACAACHGSEDAARASYEEHWAELNVLLDSLWVDTDGNGVMDPTDAGLLPQVVAQGDPVELDPTDDLITVAEGALWNAQLAHTSDRPWWGEGEVFGVSFSGQKVSGNGVHNPDLLKELLRASIDAVIARYGL